MEDEEAYSENDPLAIYLKGLNMNDFELISNNTKIDDAKSITVDQHKRTVENNKDFQMYVDIILKSELLFEEDYQILEVVHLNSAASKMKGIKILSAGSAFTLAVVVREFMQDFDIIYLFVPLCIAPITWTLFHYIKQKLRRKIMCSFLKNLYNLTDLFKKSLRMIKEKSTNFSYYSSSTLVNSTLHNLHVRFAKELYSVLLTTIKIMALRSSEIIQNVPLSIDNIMYHTIKDDFLTKTDIKITDLKLLYEFYLLVQSDFVKTLGLSFCTHLWTDPNCNFLKITTSILPSVASFIEDQTNYLRNEYNYIKNYGMNLNYKHAKKKINKCEYSAMDCLNFCLSNNQLHFQQLLCKSRDLENFLATIEPTELKSNENFIVQMLKEMETELDASKNMLEAVSKYFIQLKTKDEEVNLVEVESEIRDIELNDTKLEEIIKPGNEVYELYIPKEGFTNSADEDEKPVFSLRDLNYSTILLEELRCVLKTRNPDTFEENSQKQSNDNDNKTRSRPEIFRLEHQPVGLAENLLSFGAILRQRTLLRQEEKFGDEISETSSNENFDY